MKIQTTPPLPKVSQEEYFKMTDNEKRVYLLQVKQESTMKWQKIVAVFQSFCIFIGLLIGLFYAGYLIGNYKTEKEKQEIAVEESMKLMEMRVK